MLDHTVSNVRKGYHMILKELIRTFGIITVVLHNWYVKSYGQGYY